MKLTGEQHDILTELVNIGVGRAAASLSDLVGKRIDLSVPCLAICDLATLSTHLTSEGGRLDTLLVQDFRGTVSGRAVLAFPQTSGLKLGQILGDLDALPDEFDLDLTGILTEVANIVLNGVLGSISNMLESKLSYSVPAFSNGCNIMDLLASNRPEAEAANPTVVFADTRFRVAQSEISGSLVIVFELGDLESALNTLTSTASQADRGDLQPC